MNTRSKGSNETAEGENPSVYLLKKIFEKLESIESNQSKAIKNFEKTVNELKIEMSTIKNIVHKPSAQEEREATTGNNSKPSKQETISLSDKTRKDLEDAMNQRKHAYYKNIRSAGIATIYRGFLQSEPPFIPRKFREGHIPGESESHKLRIAVLEKTKLNLECERLEEEASKNSSILKNMEQNASKIISEIACPKKSQELKEMWIKRISEEEKISNDIWETKKTFFESLREEDTQPTKPTFQHRNKRRIKYKENSHYNSHYDYNINNTWNRNNSDTYYHNKRTGNIASSNEVNNTRNPFFRRNYAPRFHQQRGYRSY